MQELFNKIHHTDNALILSQLPDNSVDAIITDPPYELGFMNNRWDKSGIALDVFRWCEHLRVLKPSGYLLAFSSSRTYHRLASAIEEAGFEIRDQIQWLYGNGMPKAKSHLKPAHEPICVARKAGKITPLNIDAGRINNGTLPSSKSWGEAPVKRNTFSTYTKPSKDWQPPNGGRYPSNVILDETTAEILDEKSGFSKGNGKNRIEVSGDSVKSKYGGLGLEGGRPIGFETPGYGDIGGASRFFYVAKACPSERGGSTHPTVKPIKLIEQLIKLYTNENDLIFDGYGGSGTTAICCKRLNRRFILCESDEKYYHEAELRLANETPTLFDAKETDN